MIGGLKQTTSRLAIAAAAGLFTGGIALTPVQAASLGGDCCADLEERVAELEATTVRKGNRKVSVKLSGHVNRAILWWDDGHNSDSHYVDGGVTRTRFRITGNATISPGRTAGFHMENDWLVANTSVGTGGVSNCNGAINGTQCMVKANAADRSNTRKAEIWIKDERLGKVSLGKGDMASNGSSEVDLSSTSVLSYSGMADWGGGYFFRTKAGAYGPQIAASWNNLDGDSRQNRIRYDTPSIGGFTFSASHRRDVADIAVRFKKEWNSVRCAAAAAYAHDTNDKDYDFENWSSSASCIHTPSGLNLTVAYADRDFGSFSGAGDPTVAFEKEQDTEFWYAKLGIARRWNSHGKTAISIGYGKTDDSASLGDSTSANDTTAWGIDFVQFIDSAALELFAGYRMWEYDDNKVDVSYEDMDHFIMGARMKF